MRIAFVFVAEPYQCYHGVAIACALTRKGAGVSIFYNDAESLRHIGKIMAAYGSSGIECARMPRTPLAVLAEKIKVFGFNKTSLYRRSERYLSRFDAIVTVEDTAYRLFEKKHREDRPRLIYVPHGAGDGIVGFSPRTRKFDLVLVPGAKTADRMLELGLVRPDNHARIGLVKLETADRLRAARPPLFETPRPTILYNSHKTRRLASWNRFIEPLLGGVAGNDEFNLIVAPHVKKFRRRSERLRRGWEARSTGDVLIDTGSDRCLDMTYTRSADIYLGDISSQVYEFLVEPRPCVFINAYEIDWRGNPSFAHWQLGDVVSDPRDLMPALRAASARHHLYREKQEAFAAASLGDRSPGASDRAANVIMRFLRP